MRVMVILKGDRRQRRAMTNMTQNKNFVIS